VECGGFGNDRRRSEERSGSITRWLLWEIAMFSQNFRMKVMRSDKVLFIVAAVPAKNSVLKALFFFLWT